MGNIMMIAGIAVLVTAVALTVYFQKTKPVYQPQEIVNTPKEPVPLKAEEPAPLSEEAEETTLLNTEETAPETTLIDQDYYSQETTLIKSEKDK